MLFSPDELKQLAVPTPEVQAWVDARVVPPMQDVPFPTLFRSSMALLDQSIADTYGPSEDGIIEEDIDTNLRDGSPSKLRVFRPSHTPAGGSPLFVWIFGGAFAGGSRFQGTVKARHLVKLFGAVVVTIEYRLAPEHTFPTSQQDGWDHLKWIDKHANTLGANTKLGFVVGGASSGGNIAAVLVRRAQAEEPLTNTITGQWLEFPILFDNKDVVPESYRHLWLSREHCVNVPGMTSPVVEAIAKMAEWVPDSPWFTPVAYAKSFKGMPPTYFSVDGADPLRDDSLIYDELLKSAGVKTRVDVYAGCPHAHAVTMPGTGVAQKADVDGIIAAGWLLGKDISAEQVDAAAPRKQVK